MVLASSLPGLVACRRQVQNLELEDEITKMEQELERMRGFL